MRRFLQISLVWSRFLASFCSRAAWCAAFIVLADLGHAQGQNPSPTGQADGEIPPKSSASSPLAKLISSANPLAIPRLFNPFFWSEVSRDDAQSGNAPHLNNGTIVNLTAGSRAYRAFLNWQVVEFAYAGLNPSAEYRLKLGFPAGKSIPERSSKFPPGGVRTQKVYANGIEVSEAIKVGQRSPFIRELVLPKDVYATGSMQLRIQSDINAVVSSVVLTSNVSAKLPATSGSANTAAVETLDYLVDAQSWQNPVQLSKGWNSLGRVGDEECFYTDSRFLFGGAEGSYAMFRTKNGRLNRVEIVLAEQSHLNLNDVQAKTALNLARKESRFWKTNLKDAEIKITEFLERNYGESRRVTLDSGTPLSIVVQQYTNNSQPTCVRVKRTPIILSVTIEPACFARNRSQARADWPSGRLERARRLRDTVEVLENGDHRIQLGGCQQLGPYCAMGTVAMVANHMGVDLNVFDFAAQAGYDIIPKVLKEHNNVHKGLAQVTRTNCHCEPKEALSPSLIHSLVDAGTPIICYRFMSWRRIEAHKALGNPTPLLPPEALDRKNWPKNDPANRDFDYHASLITGYNPQRREVILSESWGQEFINAERIRVEEILATTTTFFWWAP